MKTLLQFLVKHSVFLLFIALETVAFILIVYGNEYPRSAVFSSANRISAGVYEIESEIVGYFGLKAQNEELNKENAALLDRIASLENRLETSTEDSASYTYAHLDMAYIPAKVINASTNAAQNYLTLNKGRRDGVQADMGVVNDKGVVGIVSAVSERYALVIPLIHPDISVSCQIKKNGYVGSLQWFGRDYRHAKLLDIAQHIQVEEGDSIVTSGLSAIFPANLPIGTIESIATDDAYYDINVHLAADYKRMGYVRIISQHNIAEQQQLEQTGAHK